MCIRDRLGADWADRKFFASNYFDKMYECAVGLIKKGKAYVSDLTPDEIREYRGTLTEAGKEDPYSKRSVEENLDLFERMKNGEFEDGTKVLLSLIHISLFTNLSPTSTHSLAGISGMTIL